MYWFGLVSVEVEKSSIATETENQFFFAVSVIPFNWPEFFTPLRVAKLSLKLFFIKNFMESKIKILYLF